MCLGHLKPKTKGGRQEDGGGQGRDQKGIRKRERKKVQVNEQAEQNERVNYKTLDSYECGEGKDLNIECVVLRKIKIKCSLHH